MAFMVPVVKKEWDIYGSSAKSRREQAQRSGRSRTTSEASQQGGAVSRGPSFGSRPAGGSLSCSPAADGWPGRHQSRSSSRGSNLSQTACSPPSRGVTFGPARRRGSQPAAGSPSQSAPGSFSGFHTKVVDRMMRALHVSDRDDSRKS